MLLLVCGQGAVAQDLNVTLESNAIVRPERASALNMFDGKFVNEAFVDRLTDRPVLHWELVENGDAPLLAITIQRPRRIETVVLTEPLPNAGHRVQEGGQQRAGMFGGYPILFRAETETSISLDPDTWDFFGEPDSPYMVSTTEVQVRRVPRIHGQGQGLWVPAFSVTEQASMPTGSAPWRVAVEINAPDGQTLGGSSMTTQASSSSDSTADACAEFGEARAEYARQQLEEMRDGALNDFNMSVGSSIIAAYVGARFGPQGAGAASSAVATGVENSSSYGLEATFRALQSWQHAQMVTAEQMINEAICRAAAGIDPSIAAALIEIMPQAGGGPAPGAQLTAVCLEWSEDYETFEEVGEGEYELVLHSGKCVRFTFLWLET
ncbi:hypothetical protein [Pelagovum pacificum]|uniref:Uncharacterized protein n=1 Tax=Pelagovum pacificum TaxID=2588711 RepID=A0A5C5GGG6_9RHOB|nr:hypothetical protein [Pelagovum pacificum]QQA43761.1 hypothetical protein I8N54_04065 [Pelagovum pacificum]TNY33109.1 hypothetical protein FHY64_07470 [Pelagovum pacificum]